MTTLKRKIKLNYGEFAIIKRIAIAKSKTINVKATEIAIYQGEQSDYISLTDIASYKDAGHTDDIIKNWLRNRNTIE